MQQPSPLPTAGAVGRRTIAISLIFVSVLKLPLLRRCLQQPRVDTETMSMRAYDAWALAQSVHGSDKTASKVQTSAQIGVQCVVRGIGSRTGLYWIVDSSQRSRQIILLRHSGPCWGMGGRTKRHLVLWRDVQHRIQTIGERRVPFSAICCCAIGHLVLQHTLSCGEAADVREQDMRTCHGSCGLVGRV
jgi:hypothetical protein